MSWKYSLRSIFHWIIPFASVNMQKHPVMTLVTFTFHICLLVTPVFLLSHAVLWDESWNLQLWTLPDPVSDVMTLAVIGCCVFFGVRRIKLPEVRYLTSASDYVHSGDGCGAVCDRVYRLSSMDRLPFFHGSSYPVG